MGTVNNSHAIIAQMGDKSSRIILIVLLESLYAGPMLKEVYCNLYLYFDFNQCSNQVCSGTISMLFIPPQQHVMNVVTLAV